MCIDVVNYGADFGTRQQESAGIGVIGDRLKEERERLGLTQPDFAAAAGAAKRTLIEWEKGNTSPSAVQLSALSSIGVDALYVLLGVRNTAMPALRSEQEQAGYSTEILSKEEQVLLDNYRNSPPEGQACLKTTSAAFAQSAKGLKKGKAA